MPFEIRVDDIKVELPTEQAGQIIGKALAAREQRADAAEKALVTVREDADKQNAQATTEKDQLRARASLAENKVAELERQKKDAEEALPILVNARVQLLEQARGILGVDAKFDKLDDLAIKKTVIAKLRPSLKIDGESADFVNGMYAMAIEEHQERVAKGGVTGARILSGPTRTDGPEMIDVESAKAKARKDSEEAWRGPLSAGK